MCFMWLGKGRNLASNFCHMEHFGSPDAYQVNLVSGMFEGKKTMTNNLFIEHFVDNTIQSTEFEELPQTQPER